MKRLFCNEPSPVNPPSTRCVSRGSGCPDFVDGSNSLARASANQNEVYEVLTELRCIRGASLGHGGH